MEIVRQTTSNFHHRQPSCHPDISTFSTLVHERLHISIA